MSRGTAIAGIDQGINLTGWCVGDGGAVPTAGAWRFAPTGADVGQLGDHYMRALRRLHADHGLGWVVYEAPLIARGRDQTLYLRKRFGIDMLLETFCRDEGIVCCEEPFGPIKRELAGRSSADKNAMVAVAAGRLGVELPALKAHGREDAADAVGAWLIGVRYFAKQHLSAWDRRLYTPAGRLALGVAND